MSGHHPVSKLFERFPPEEMQEIRANMDALREEMTLQELREALSLRQGELGKRLGIKQSAVSRMENRNDMYLSHLRKVVEAMGGELVLTARFPHAEIRLNEIAAENGCV